jgi:hypothetical protein
VCSYSFWAAGAKAAAICYDRRHRTAVIPRSSIASARALLFFNNKEEEKKECWPATDYYAVYHGIC